MRIFLLTCFACAALPLAACEKSANTTDTPAVLPSSPDQWLGKWNGVEGTSLSIEKTDDAFAVTITNLDGPRHFPALNTQRGLIVTRDDATLVIHPGTGRDTGMKWLEDKKNCLVVAPNEGYCRD
jgi:hypothetical protein